MIFYVFTISVLVGLVAHWKDMWRCFLLNIGAELKLKKKGKGEKEKLRIISKAVYGQSELELGKLCKTAVLNTFVLVLFICQVIQVCKETIAEILFEAFRKDLIVFQKDQDSTDENYGVCRRQQNKRNDFQQ